MKTNFELKPNELKHIRVAGHIYGYLEKSKICISLFELLNILTQDLHRVEDIAADEEEAGDGRDIGGVRPRIRHIPISER